MSNRRLVRTTYCILSFVMHYLVKDEDCYENFILKKTQATNPSVVIMLQNSFRIQLNPTDP